MEEASPKNKIVRRTSDKPMFRWRTMDLLFIMQRHAVFTIAPDAANRISNIIFAQQDGDDLDHIKKFEMMEEFHSDYDPQNRNKPRAAPKLRAAIEQARVKWAEILRDENLADVRIIIMPSEERDFEHIYPPVDVNEHPFGNQLQRCQGIRELLVEEGGGMPYHFQPRSKDRLTMELDLVIGREELERVATPYIQEVLNFKILDITAPAPPQPLERVQSTEDRRREESLIADRNLNDLVAKLKERYSTPKQTVRKAPKIGWNHPYPAEGALGNTQPDWTADKGPFSQDVYDTGSNDDWVTRDLEMRAAQLNKWQEAKQAREAASRTREPCEFFTRMEGLARCKTYTADRNMEWYSKNVAGTVENDYRAAKAATERAEHDYKQAVQIHDALINQYPQNLEAIEFYRQMQEGQIVAIGRAKYLQETVGQGLPPAPRPRMRRDMPIQESHKLDAMHGPQPGTEMEFDEDPTGPAMQSGKAKDISSFAPAEPGHTPIPKITGDNRNYGPTLRPSAHPTADRQDTRGRAQPREETRGSRILHRTPDQGKGQLSAHKRSTDLTRYGRTDAPARRPAIGTPIIPQIPVNQTERKLHAGPEGAARKTNRRVSFRLPGDTPPLPSNEPPKQHEKENAPISSNKESKIPKPASRPYARRMAERPSEPQHYTSARRMPSLAHTTEEPFKSHQCPPSTTPAAPSGFEMRDARNGREQDDAVTSLRLAAQNLDVLDRGSQQGRFPTLRRIVSGLAGGLPRNSPTEM